VCRATAEQRAYCVGTDGLCYWVYNHMSVLQWGAMFLCPEGVATIPNLLAPFYAKSRCYKLFVLQVYRSAISK